MQLRASEVAAATRGELIGADHAVDGVAIDSRLLRGGELFVALVHHRDGHDFVPAAVASGARAYLTSRGPLTPDDDASAIVVPDTAEGLLDVGRLARSMLPDRVVGITGSVGKTTVKDLAAAALGARFVTAASERSFNNELGVPLTLANASAGTEAVVVEMGARGPGHIGLLCSVARPTIGVVTVVAPAHVEHFGSLDGVAAGKGELIEALPASGTAILNADDERVLAMAGRTTAAVMTFSMGGAPADLVAEDVHLDADIRPSFRLRSPFGAARVRVPFRGHHQVTNALAAIAAALAAGVVLDEAVEGLSAASPSPWRMALGRTTGGALVLNDAYNANPASMASALDALSHLPARRRVAVLGTMAELGDDAPAEHRRAAAAAVERDIEVVAVDCDLYGDLARHVDDLEEALLALGPVGHGDAILVKGSRVAGLERLAEQLLEGP